ncbi:hypothetical protein BD414DRAFT_487513, partial [Trametes punicea]
MPVLVLRSMWWGWRLTTCAMNDSAASRSTIKGVRAHTVPAFAQPAACTGRSAAASWMDSITVLIHSSVPHSALPLSPIDPHFYQANTSDPGGVSSTPLLVDLAKED